MGAGALVYCYAVRSNVARRKGSKRSGYVIEWYGDEIIEAIGDQIEDALFQAGQIMVQNAAAKAPRDEGTLQESGYVATQNKSTYVKRAHHKTEVRPRGEGVAVIAFSAPHSHLVEFGTVKMAAQPFFRPAFDESKAAMTEEAVKTLREGLPHDAG